LVLDEDRDDTPQRPLNRGGFSAAPTRAALGEPKNHFLGVRSQTSGQTGLAAAGCTQRKIRQKS